MGRWLRLGICCSFFFSFFRSAMATSIDYAALPQSLIGLGFEELMNINVTSVSKKEERFFSTPAAAYIITSDDIRRSGATNIPEALRLAPGIEVAQIDAHTWAITSRGFNSTTANKLLVLIDGRSVYTPLFSGVFWDVQDVLLTDVDRIEVIRGPGATVWGANAVNGVINIIRKSAPDTQGIEMRVAAGSEDRLITFLRYGDRLGNIGHYRAYAKYRDRDDTHALSSAFQNDEAHFLSGGFRSDWAWNETDTFVVQGDVYGGKEGQTSTISKPEGPFSLQRHDQTEVSGGNVLSSWARTFDNEAHLNVQFYYDRTNRTVPLSWAERLDTYDLEIKHRFPLDSVHEISWGGGWRIHRDVIDNTFSFGWEPPNKTFDVANIFVQDELRLRESLRLTLGSKFEHNDYTGFETQPGARLAWTPNRINTLWTSVSRAMRTPSRLDTEAVIRGIGGSPAFSTEVQLLGTAGFEAERLTAFEAGYRVRPTTRLFLDIVGFHNIYRRLRSLEPLAPILELSPPSLTLPFTIQNQMNAKSYGVELASEWHVIDRWKLHGTYSYFHVRLDPEDDSGDTTSVSGLDTSPAHQIGLRSSWDLPAHFQFDVTGRYVDNLPTLGVQSYEAADVRLGWTGIPQLELELVAQSVLKPRHREYSPANEMEDNIYGRATWRFP